MVESLLWGKLKMLKWLKSLFCSHNEVVTVIYYTTEISLVSVYKEYTCMHCGKTWRELLSKYPYTCIPMLRDMHIRSIEEIYDERTCQ